jgi:hypothetical protein
MQEKRYFSLDEAERALPKVAQILDRLHTIKAQVNLLSADHAEPKLLSDPFTEEQSYRFAFAQEIIGNDELHKHICKFLQVLERVEGIGCTVADLDRGLVDFPHLLNNKKEILFCWQESEEHINSWHSASKCLSRKPIIDMSESGAFRACSRTDRGS